MAQKKKKKMKTAMNNVLSQKEVQMITDRASFSKTVMKQDYQTDVKSNKMLDKNRLRNKSSPNSTKAVSQRPK